MRGTVVEPYELYSIHQDSMALMGLHGAAQATCEERFRDAAVSGLDWNHGANELGVEMFDRTPRAASPDGLELNRTMRPYHLGWILEAWAGREELARDEA